MKVDFDNMRRQTVSNYNTVVVLLNRHIEAGNLNLDEVDFERLHERIHDLKMCIVTLAFLSGENETFGEVGDDNTTFVNLERGVVPE